MAVSIETNVRYECRLCGVRWVLPMRVKLTAEIVELSGNGDPFSRPFSVSACPGCLEKKYG